jgi:adenylate cyclase
VKKYSLRVALGLLIVMLLLGNASQLFKLDFVDHIATFLYDYQLKLTMPRTLDERIVILDIDEKSLKEEGRWPWGRDRLALLMDKLFDQYGVAVVGFDVVFAERDTSSGLQVLQSLAQNQLKNDLIFQAELARLRPQLEYDRLFADSIKHRNVVMGYYLSDDASARASGALPDPAFPKDTFAGMPIGFSHWTGYGANLPELQFAAAAGGHFNPQVDIDGNVRKVPILAEYGGAYYESLSLAMVRAVLGQPPLIANVATKAVDGYDSLESLALDLGKDGKLVIPVDGSVSAFVPYRGEQGSFRYISLTDVLHGRVNPSWLAGKIVLVGTTAPGLIDMRATPVGEVFPGVEVHANLISGILDQTLKREPPFMHGAEIIWLLLVGGTLAFLLPRFAAPKIILASVLAFALTSAMSLAAWHYSDILMPVANSFLMIALLFALTISYGYFVESRNKRQITNLFGQYVPSELVDEMSKNPTRVSMESRSEEMTILFSDVRGFTSISEKMDAKTLSKLINSFLTPLSKIVYNHRGTIDKYMGDCIMAFWGAPLSDEQHARHALIAGLEMLAALKALQPSFKEKGWPEIRVGVGINTGRVSVGNMGSDVRVAYTVMGDAVNLASRLEGITKQYGVDMIVGENTKRAVPDFLYRELDYVCVKGKNEPVAIYEPIGVLTEVDETRQREVQLFNEMRKVYLQQNWSAAEKMLAELHSLSPDSKLYLIYSARVASLKLNPPTEQWDGVFVFDSK